MLLSPSFRAVVEASSPFLKELHIKTLLHQIQLAHFFQPNYIHKFFLVSLLNALKGERYIILKCKS